MKFFMTISVILLSLKCYPQSDTTIPSAEDTARMMSFYNKATNHYDNEKYKEAKKYFRKSKKASTSYKLDDDLGITLCNYYMDKDRKAWRQINRILKKDPTFGEAYFYRALFNFELEKNNQALFQKDIAMAIQFGSYCDKDAFQQKVLKLKEDWYAENKHL